MSSWERFNEKFKQVLELPDLRKKILFTLAMFLVARVGTHIPAPGVDIERLTSMVNSNDLLGFFNMFSGGAFMRVSIFSLGVMPYINASIIVQLLGVLVPKLEELQKEGESGRQKITQWTRYLTIVIAIIQGLATVTWLQQVGLVTTPGFLFTINTITVLTAGSVFLMWVGEQITIKGIGNGVSLLIFLNIVSRMPGAISDTLQKMSGNKFLIPVLLIGGIISFVAVLLITIVQLGVRQIPIQYVGKGFSGKNIIAKNTYLPVKVNVAGIMPVIFASVLMAIPSLVLKILPSTMSGYVLLNKMFEQTHPVYLILEAILIMFFSFFYTAMMFDPEKVAENLKQSGGTIPGIRPGIETVEYLEKVVTRITWVGATFLTFVAVGPVFIFSALNMPIFFQGTGIIIMVGVGIDTIQQINAQLVMKNYKGFIK
ncbi:MAG: preprotein translocase subunit SecY [Fusobacteriaceae bacterium]|nr:preprotein translocase subunit SecY [Fusobacteriaceae bacterium]MBP6466657.1 preprotein translocase subunit SecY [Fusobacteriaceae bacterium]MBP9595474.1 preprotein translocase subunit SecY [Fusobacteriaceae bacterium]MBU9917190.1 preprotein translocase subunit SecY [Fusobacteriaceae bacterium]